MVGPILLAIDAMNARAVAAILKHDIHLNLRESLRGPKDQLFMVEEGHWIYTYTKKVQSQSVKMTRTFSNLGMALLVAKEKS